MPKRPTFGDSPAFGGKKDVPSPPSSPKSPKNSNAHSPAALTLLPCSNPPSIRTILPSAVIPTRHPGPRQPPQCPLPNTANLLPNPLIRPPTPPKTPPKPCHRPPIQRHDPPNALLEWAEPRGNEREIGFSFHSPRNCIVGTREVSAPSFCIRNPCYTGPAIR